MASNLPHACREEGSIGRVGGPSLVGGLRSGITKVSNRPEIFPFTEVIGWILPKVDAIGMIMNNVEDK